MTEGDRIEQPEYLPQEEYEKIEHARDILASVDDEAVPEDINVDIETMIDWADKVADRRPVP